MTAKVHVEELLGREVVDANGRKAGRILEIVATKEGAHCFVDEYRLGASGLLTRLGMTSAQMVGIHLNRDPKRVPWQQMDLSDPEHPRLKVAIEEIR